MMDGQGIGNQSWFRSPESLLRAGSVAIVGASDHSPWSKTLFANLEASGFPGPVYPINARYREIWGVECYPDFGAVPQPADLALVVVPAGDVLPVLEEGTRHGLKSALVYAANFGEGDNPEDLARGATLAELCAKTGLRVCGPNCMGFVSVRERLIAYPNPDFVALEPGPVGLVFQSGGSAQHWVHAGSERGLSFSYVITSGNEIDLTLADYVDFLIDDDATGSIVLFIEAIRRPEAFMAAAARALKVGKPILTLKAGRNEKSREAAKSHTGAICGDMDAYLAMCERYGIINCQTYEELIETTLAFQCGRLPKGRRMGLVTNSGANVHLLHDYIEEYGAEVPDLSPSTIERLRPLIAPGVKVTNPLDGGIGTGFPPSKAAPACVAVAQDPNIDMIAWTMRLPASEESYCDPQPLKDLLAKTDKPVVAFERMVYSVTDTGRAYQEETEIPFLQGLRSTVSAMSWLGFYGERVGRDIPALPEPTGRAVDVEPGNLQVTLSGFGIPPPVGGFAETPERAAQVAEVIGYPVALKVVSPQVSHKRVAGGVKLNLRDAEEVERATTEMGLVVTAAGATLAGFVVQEMVNGVEMLVGARDDPLYGPIMVVGTGGMLTELMMDAAFRMLPVSEDEARSMLSELRATQLLAGYRGQPPADVDALIAAIHGLSNFYLDHRTWLAEFEINPLTVLTRGHGVRAVDIRPVHHPQ